MLEGAASFGEIGLTGRLRPASQADRRLDECGKFGIATVIAPEGAAPRPRPRVLAAETLRAAVKAGLAEHPAATGDAAAAA
ncbi:MAG: hypothetical protein A2Y55_09970 [Actinobacteria bacterium RBG_16_68_12]|nr:MAG: hypothetical protein A2Y55_09970 [Actinobacteria bacterium RBG_16_68_12]